MCGTVKIGRRKCFNEYGPGKSRSFLSRLESISHSQSHLVLSKGVLFNMTIYEQIKQVLVNDMNQMVSPAEVKKRLQKEFGTNPSSIILSDYCYNRYNKGIGFNNHVFQYITKNTYKYLGEHYLYTGLIFHKPKGQEREVIVGEWRNGVKILFEATENADDAFKVVSTEQIARLYEEYNQVLRYEMNLLHCNPTELRHLIGRIGEFLCAILTNGNLSRQVNQHGFDVVSNGRRISVKTTAQTTGFIPLNQNTFTDFDDLFVVQYVDDDFKVIYYGAKEEVQKIARTYGTTFEIDISRLKMLYREIHQSS